MSKPGQEAKEATPRKDFFIPAGTFDPAPGAVQAASAPISIRAAAPPTSAALGSAKPLLPRVFLYVSPSTQDFFSNGGLDTRLNPLVWERFLRKYKVAYQVVDTVARLETALPGVLVLPSSVALSARERQAIHNFRVKGGSVLASWLSGVRGERGEWLGFGFMESTLGAKVLGTTEANADDRFIMPNGDSPVTHHLGAGQRIWTDRPDGWHPLRLSGGQTAAHIMDWSRSDILGKVSATVVFDERNQGLGAPSRSVVLGYPERLWLAADPKSIEAIAHNALMWLLRQPDAYLAAWPHPYSSAFVLAVDALDFFVDGDLEFAKRAEQAGARATYYLLGENVKKSADIIKQIQARGHDLGLLGDRFVGFAGQPSSTQAQRLDGVRSELKSAGIEVPREIGFHAPMELDDATTSKLLVENGVDHHITFSNDTDSRLPFISPLANAKGSKAMVVLPRTQNGPEDVLEDEGPANILKTYLAEMNLAQQMGGLSVIRIPNQSLLRPEDLDAFFKDMQARSTRMWMSSARRVSQWWRERERISVQLESLLATPLLTVTITGAGPLTQAAAVYINLPEPTSTLRLLPKEGTDKSPTVAHVDIWRSAVTLQGWTPGVYRWQLQFDRPGTGTK